MDAGAGAARITEDVGSPVDAPSTGGEAAPPVHRVADPVELHASAAPASARTSASASASADFDALFRSTYPALVRALSVAADGGAAADAVQEAFVQAHLHWRRVGRLDNPGAWVRRAAINRLANHRRGIRRRRLRSPGWTPGSRRR